MIVLPPSYIEQMQRMLGGEAERFLASYEATRTQGLRLNTLKINPGSSEAFGDLQTAFGLEPVPWCQTGYYYRDDARPGKHPMHAAGAYYIQEPSAMSAVELLAPEPGDIVLDLAAAPGGKSTHIADKLQGRGLLISNEIHPARAKILAENIERMGVANAVVVSAAPQQLAERFPAFFDKMMVDAPCSGEGMFRKDPDAIGEWSLEHVEMCAARQLDILGSAVVMLKPGGRLAYSTCTFNELENEGTVKALLARFPQLKLVRKERIWPHLVQGEGHFVAVFEMDGEENAAGEAVPLSQGLGKSKDKAPRGKRNASRPEADAMKLLHKLAESIGGENFASAVCSGEVQGSGSGVEPLLFGEQLYLLPQAAGCPFGSGSLQGLKVLRPGLHAAELKKDRAEPAHALALALSGKSLDQVRQVDVNEAQAESYLRGETLESPESRSGWVLVTLRGLPLGWGKQTGTQVKNHYPKGLRRP